MTSSELEVSRKNGKLHALQRFASELGAIEIGVVAVTTAISLASWLVFVVMGTPNFETFTIVYGITLAAGGVAQNTVAMYVRPLGSLRARLSGDAAANYDRPDHNFALLITPVVVSAIFFLIVTPPSTLTDSFDSDMVIYQVIALMVVLGFVFSYLGALLVFTVVVMPIALLLAALLPVDRDTDGRPLGAFLATSELAILGATVLSAVGFAVSITRVIPTPSSDSFVQRMREVFTAFVTFAGEPVATVIGWFFVVVLVGLVVAHQLLQGKKAAR